MGITFLINGCPYLLLFVAAIPVLWHVVLTWVRSGVYTYYNDGSEAPLVLSETENGTIH